MQGFAKLGIVCLLGVMVATAVGCGQQQLEERNVMLQKQLDQANVDKADLQTKNTQLTEANQALGSELDRARLALAGKGQPVPAKPKTKPEFGGGIETAIVGEATTITLPDTLMFDSGKADLKSGVKATLDKIAAVLNKDYAGDKIRVEGHTDNQPISKTSKNWDDNWELSTNRSLAVLRYLTSKGIDSKRVYAAGYSYFKPVAANDTAAGRAKNRRVVIVVYPQRGAQ
jgi:chemotaxis protein MotB